ncbi:MAG: hypothetical protein IJS94_07020, partial [Clostridia bacterium]|nr:hypothetical protein [Clostridia bacterium]
MPLSQTMKGFAESIGLKTEQETAHGIFNGYYLTVYNSSYNKGVFINFAKHPADTAVDEKSDEDNSVQPEEENAELIEEAADADFQTDPDDLTEAAGTDSSVSAQELGEDEPEEETGSAEEQEETEAADPETGLSADASEQEEEDESGEDADDQMTDFEFSNEFQTLAAKYEVKDTEIDENGISFETPVSLIKFRELLEQTIELLKKYGYAGKTHCSTCGKPFSGDMRRVYRDKFNYLVCAECAGDLLDEQERENEIIENELSTGSKGKAIGFSLLSSLVLSAVMVVLYKYILPAVPIWGNFEPGFIAAVVPFVMAGVNMMIYKHIGKRGGAERVVVSLLIALIFTVCTQYACSVIQFVRSGARTLAEAKIGVFPLTKTQLSNAASQILKMPIVHDTELYMFYKYLIVDVCAVLIGIVGFSFTTVRQPDRSLKVEEAD